MASERATVLTPREAAQLAAAPSAPIERKIRPSVLPTGCITPWSLSEKHPNHERETYRQRAAQVAHASSTMAKCPRRLPNETWGPATMSEGTKACMCLTMSVPGGGISKRLRIAAVCVASCLWIKDGAKDPTTKRPNDDTGATA